MACDSGEDPLPTPTTSAIPTPTATLKQTFTPPTHVPLEPTNLNVGPYPQATVFNNLRLDKGLILDVATGDVFTIEAGWQIMYWLDDDRLGANSFHIINLATSQIEYTDPLPTGTPFGDPHVSADGTWRLELSGDHAAVVQINGDGRVELPPSEFHGPEEQTFKWSPSGHLLAFGGGRCGDDPLLLVDPEARSVTTLHEPGARASNYTWRPDGRGLAVGLSNVEPGQIIFIDVASGTRSTMLTKPRGGEMLLGQWNPSGTRIRFTNYAGRPCPY